MFKRAWTGALAYAVAAAALVGFGPAAQAARGAKGAAQVPELEIRMHNDGGASRYRGGPGNRAAQRAAVKKKNRARNRRAHKGKSHD